MARKYQSRFGATKPIDFCQYVSETVLARQAKISGETLPQRFWNNPKFKRFYLLQIMWTRSLLARFEDVDEGESVLAEVLRSPEGLRVCTMRNPNLPGLIEAEVQRRKQQKVIADVKRAEQPPPQQKVNRSVQDRPHQPRTGGVFGKLS